MKKVAFLLGLAVVGTWLIGVAYKFHFEYHLLKNTESRWQRDIDSLSSRLKNFESQVKSLDERKVRNLKPFHLSCEISTTDQPAFTTLNAMPSNTNEIFKAWYGKGSGIEPEFRLPAGNTNEMEFKIHIPQDFGKPVDAWLSQTDVAAFERFHVYSAFRPGETNMLKLVAQVRTNSSVKMRFQIVVLCLSPD